MNQTKPIVEAANFIILDSYQSVTQKAGTYQSEADLEKELIQDLQNQGFGYRPDITEPAGMLANIKIQLERLNDTHFSDSEWNRFTNDYLDQQNDTFEDRIQKIQNNSELDFKFDKGNIRNIKLFDKQRLANNKLEVINQFEQRGTSLNRYDVTILVNGLPLVQVELKKRGVAIAEAFNQIHRYSKESFNCPSSLFKYLQMFVISNGSDTRYFANTTKRNRDSFDFTMHWAKSDNERIHDLKNFTSTFFQKNTLLNVLFHYSVLDADNTLLIMRPYQIAATERILWKIQSSYLNKQWSTPESGGFIWHTTGSGKTLTSFKAAQRATDFDFIDKVVFVVDRKDLDYQTMKEYQKFSPDSVNGSSDTKRLKENLAKPDNKIIVTTIQKLNHLMKKEINLPVYDKHVVFIFDECHRSQFGEAQKNLKKRFKKYYQFGFTGTPIFPENANGVETTASVFGRELHSYIITDAIRDEKVLKFKVDYNNVLPAFRESEELEEDPKNDQLSAQKPSLKSKEALNHLDRIKEISSYILQNFNRKTHRLGAGNSGFNAMLAVQDIEAAKRYYIKLKELQKDLLKPLKIATIFSFAANEEQDGIGSIPDEEMGTDLMDKSAKEFLASAVADYNRMFKTNFSIEGHGFQDYYRDLSEKVKKGKVDLIIVVGMFLTGFDAPRLNTLFVDKYLGYHGLIQAYSRTNRILDKTKAFGNIVTFRDLDQATQKAIALFGDKENVNLRSVVLEKSFKDYMYGFKDLEDKAHRGFVEIVQELETRFSAPAEIVLEQEKKDFVKLFGEFLKLENVLINFDEFTYLHKLRDLDKTDKNKLEEFKVQYQLTTEELDGLLSFELPSDRLTQDYKSAYNDIREWVKKENAARNADISTVDWNAVVFEMDLLKSQEINLDYILKLVFENHKNSLDKPELLAEISRLIKSSPSNRSKEPLLVEFITSQDLDEIQNDSDMTEQFFNYARARQEQEADELIKNEGLNVEKAKNLILTSLKQGFVSENGTGLKSIMPPISPLNPQYLVKKQDLFQKLSAFVEKYKDIGGQI